MKSTFKALGASVLALSLASSGYGDWLSEFRGFAERGKFPPRVTKDARAVLGVNLDKEQVFRAVDLYAERVCTIAQLDASKRAMVKEKIAAYKQDVFADVPADGRRYLEECRLCDANFRWAVVSLESITYEGAVPHVEGLSVALAGQFDFEKFILFVQRKTSEKDDNSVSFRKVAVRGEDAWQLVPKDSSLAREWREAGFDPHVTSLDGQLVLASSSRDALAKQIHLYRTGEGRGDALGDFSARKGELLHLTLPGIREFVPQSLVPGDWLLFEGLELDLTLSPDGKVSEALRVRDGSATILTPAILMAAIFPAISRSMQTAKSDEKFLVVEKGEKDKVKHPGYKSRRVYQGTSGRRSSAKGSRQLNAREDNDADYKALSDVQRALIDELQEALDDESFCRVAKVVKKIQDDYRKGGDAAVTPYMREQAVEALSWFLPDSLAELIGFMADSNPDVLEGVMKNFTEGIDDAELSDRELADIFKKIAPMIKDDDAIDAILMGLENDMRNSVAVDTYKEIFKTGSEEIKKRLVESMQDFTGEDDITTPEQLDAWLRENPDDEDDEHFYGKADKDADDGDKGDDNLRPKDSERKQTR